MATTKTYYPSFRLLVRNLALYIGRHGASMQLRLGINNTQFQTDLTNLSNALNQVINNWPDYTETQ